MQTKSAVPPVSHLGERRAPPIVRAYFEINQLKSLLRQGWLRCGVERERCESVAEHSFGVAMLAMLVCEAYFPELDPLRVLRMALLHDIGEVHAGDLTPYDGVDREEKRRRERESVVAILGTLPGGENWIAIWDEYERGNSGEARLVRAMDRLELLLQATIYEHEGFGDLSEFFASIELAVADGRLSEIIESLPPLRRAGGSSVER